jgi:uncharacterized protein YabE (DUF348 family)
VPDLDTLPPRSALPRPGARPARRRHLPVRPSPARARPHDPSAWLPVPDVDALPEVVHVVTAAPADAPPSAPAPERQEKRAPTRSSRRPQVGLRAVVAGVAALAVLVAVIALAVPRLFGDTGAPEIELTIGDSTTTVATDAANVGDALEAEGVKIRFGDEVKPALETPITDGMAVVVSHAILVHIDVDGAITDVSTAAGSVKQLQRKTPELAGKKFITDPTDPTDPADPLVKDGVYAFRTPRTVMFFPGREAVGQPERTTALSVGEFITSQGIPLAPGDYVNPPIDTPIPVEGNIEIRMLNAAEFAEVSAALNSAAVDNWLNRDITPSPNGPTGPFGGPVPGPAGLPPAGNSQDGTATFYEYTPGTCAHLTLPFGTVVTVTNVATGASTTCVVADRGPEAWTGHIIDLTPGVFAQIAPLSSGVVRVHLSW